MTMLKCEKRLIGKENKTPIRDTITETQLS